MLFGQLIIRQPSDTLTMVDWCPRGSIQHRVPDIEKCLKALNNPSYGNVLLAAYDR